MDIELEMLNFYKDHAIAAKRAYESFIFSFIIAFITIFVPLSYAFPAFGEIFKQIVMLIPLIVIPVIFYYFLKYREYKYKYLIVIARHLRKEIIEHTKCSNCNFRYDDVIDKIWYTTLFDRDDIVKVLYILDSFEKEYMR